MTVKAKESRQVEKVRRKLAKVLEEEHSHFNKENLQNVRASIHKWLNRHETDRFDSAEQHVEAEERIFTFNENKNPSEVRSKFVLNLLNELKNEEHEHDDTLRGRIKKSDFES